MAGSASPKPAPAMALWHSLIHLRPRPLLLCWLIPPAPAPELPALKGSCSTLLSPSPMSPITAPLSSGGGIQQLRLERLQLGLFLHSRLHPHFLERNLLYSRRFHRPQSRPLRDHRRIHSQPAGHRHRYWRRLGLYNSRNCSLRRRFPGHCFRPVRMIILRRLWPPVVNPGNARVLLLWSVILCPKPTLAF